MWGDLGLRKPGAPVEVKLDVRWFKVLKGLRGAGDVSLGVGDPR